MHVRHDTAGIQHSTSTGSNLPAGRCDHLEIATFAEEQSPVPLLLGHQVVSQPHLRQADEVGQSIKFGHFRDSVRAKMQELKASEVGQVSQAPQPVMTQVQAP